MRTRPNAAWIAALALALALVFLGARGIWDPDEGRYTNVALNMLDSGDWLNPRRSHEVGHWTKPPLTYWAIAASVGAFGANPWAARLPSALAYLLCVWLAWRVARRLAPGAEAQAALAYATMLLPFGASQLITTDFLLAASVGTALWAFVEARFGIGRHPLRWLTLMWAAFALSFLTKGPPALLGLLVVLAFDLLVRDHQRHAALQRAGLALFALLALPWYVAVVLDHPGLLRYFLGDEVLGRVATDEFHRNGEWYGWLTVYAPTLLLGTLPWTPALVRWARTLPAQARAWRDVGARDADRAGLMLALWVLLPLVVFCVARSRLPLYLLPLFLPLAVIVARQRAAEGRGLPPAAPLLLWAALLLGLKVAAAHWPTHKNAAHWAEAIRARADEPIEEVVFVEDMARYGLHLHLGPGTQIEKVSVRPRAEPAFNPDFDETLAQELAEREPGVVWVCKQAHWPELRARIEALGWRATPLGTPYRQRVLFRAVPNASETSAGAAPPPR